MVKLILAVEPLECSVQKPVEILPERGKASNYVASVFLLNIRRSER
jgi:hypothetical protein